MTTKQKKERPSLVMMIYMWIFILVALVNLVGIASQNLYQSIFPFFHCIALKYRFSCSFNFTCA